MRARLQLAILLIPSVLALSTGCTRHHAVELGLSGRDGRVYYLDGAGGGGGLTNWGNGVRDGLKVAGFEGDFANFRWQTGAGIAVDQLTPAGMKRVKARKLAEMIREHKDANFQPAHPSSSSHSRNCGRTTRSRMRFCWDLR